MKCFEAYKLGVFDEMFDEQKVIRPHWETLARNLQNITLDGLTQKQHEIDWQHQENGVTYNIYSEKQHKRKWNLDPIPFLLAQDEWLTLQNGIKQRMKLLDAIFKDIYSEQILIKKGILPVEVLYLDSHFIREVHNFNPEYFNLNLYAIDISRGPDGKFWVISDKTDSPSGLGYAVENRITMNSISSDLIKNIHINRIAEFLDGFKSSIQKYSLKDDPFIVMLSPGPYNETYFEQSYLSSILGCELVRGEDLLVKDDILYLKNLSGLKQIDIIIRRVDDRFCDPLELRNDSQLGVAGLLEVLRSGNAIMINPIGVGILENLALNPFLNNICKYFFNEELLLPQIATWWCGQEQEKIYVLENLSQLIVKTITKSVSQEIYVCDKMSKEELAVLKDKILHNPYIYIAQEQIEFSSTPTFVHGDIEARKNSIRLFSYKDDNQYHVMQGGLVRVSSNKDTFIVSNQKGGGSKDLWILSKDNQEIPNPNNLRFEISQEKNIGSLTTKRAENIYWLGRYLQRSIIVARVLRLNIKYMINQMHYDNSIISEVLDIITKALTHLTMTYPGFLSQDIIDPINEFKSLVYDRNRIGSLTFTLSMLSNVNLNIKNQLSNENRKVFDKFESIWFQHANNKRVNFRQYAENLDTLLIYLTSYKELLKESIFKEQGIVFYQIGANVEMAMLQISKIRSLLTSKYDKNVENEILQFILHSYEGYNAYKSFYRSSIDISLVLDYLIFEKSYPKSLLSIMYTLLSYIHSIHHENEILFQNDKSNIQIKKVITLLSNMSAKDLLTVSKKSYVYEDFDTLLNDITALLIQFSDEFTKNYFSHYYE